VNRDEWNQRENLIFDTPSLCERVAMKKKSCEINYWCSVIRRKKNPRSFGVLGCFMIQAH
jgi:hypothetical protein